jgi:hypothetical protein
LEETEKITPGDWSRVGIQILVVVVVKTGPSTFESSRASLNIKLVFPPAPEKLTTPLLFKARASKRD